MEKIIDIMDLKKSYGEIEAVKGVNFYVEKGSLFAFLGRNGAGKSTTIDMISTLLEPDSGQVTINGYVLGKDDDKIRSIIGIVFQDHVLDDLLTIKENLMIRGSFYHKNKEELKAAVDYAVKSTSASDFLDRPYGQLSGGQRRRADIARALVSLPEILILDEPTTGLDPHTRQDVWNAVEQLQKERNMTIFLTTHYMEEAAKADYVVVIEKGNIVAKGTPAEIKDQYSNDHLIIHTAQIDEISQLLSEMGYRYEVKGDTLTVQLESTISSLPILEKCKDRMIGFQVIEGNMDNAFINITGKEISE